jgi:hypothetical protein
MGFDLGADIAAQVEAQISESLGTIDFDLIAQHEIQRAIHQAQREIEKARRRVEREQESTEERIRRAQERASRAARRAQERIERRARQWSTSFGTSPYAFGGARAKPKSQATEEEQLAILKMVQSGKISVKEAERLLKALEG